MASTSTDEYETVMINEGGFQILLSNRGGKKHGNPTPINWSKSRKQCRFAGCIKETKTDLQLCSNHRSKWKEFKHSKDWIGLIKPDTELVKDAQQPSDKKRPLLKAFASAHYEATEYLVRWVETKPKERFELVNDFIVKTLNDIVASVPDATTLQSNLETKSGHQPSDTADLVRKLIDSSFPFDSFSNTIIEDVRLKLDLRLGIVSQTKEILIGIPVRIIASNLVVGLICEEINRGDAWFRKQYNCEPDVPKMGGAYMSIVYYYLRSYTNATPHQARMCLK